jgi:mono/diheme cytochrome c family protein
VRSGDSRDSFARRLLLATPLVFLLLSGCDPDGYPADLKYPMRGDPILDKAPPNVALGVYPDPPGQLQLPLELETNKEITSAVKLFKPVELSGAHRSAVQAALEKHFGTPANPTVTIAEKPEKAFAKVFTQEDAEKANATLDLILPESKTRNEELAAGSKLFRRHCLHCHGVSGDGRGPTGPWLHPHPRDYRMGVFKFVAAKGQKSGDKFTALPIQRPAREDLLRILRSGVDGTSMPSFHLLSETELNLLVSYVIHLALRGEVEQGTLREIAQQPAGKLALSFKNSEQDDDTTDDIALYVAAVFRDSLLKNNQWATAAESKFYRPADPAARETPESKAAAIVNGYNLFINKDKGGCLACHDDFGRNAKYRYDNWGTMVRPRDLTLGQYRGGRRPIDLFWRVKAGISGTPMPAAVPSLSDEDLWQIVDFVQALPYPKMMPEGVREKVYPTLKID